jgi:hypothetical protein
MDYLAIPQNRFNDCPLEWWKMIEKKFPILSMLAKYICVYLRHHHPVRDY